MNEELKKFIDSKSTAELADTLARKLEEYKTASMDSNLTLSIPSLDMMIEISKELSRRLKS